MCSRAWISLGIMYERWFVVRQKLRCESCRSAVIFSKEVDVFLEELRTNLEDLARDIGRTFVL